MERLWLCPLLLPLPTPKGTLQKRTVFENQRLNTQLVKSSNEPKLLPVLNATEESLSPKPEPLKVTIDEPVEGPLLRPPTELTAGAL